MKGRRARRGWRASRLKTAFEIGFGLGLLAVALGRFALGWENRTTLTVAVMVFLLGAALWLLRPLLQWGWQSARSLGRPRAARPATRATGALAPSPSGPDHSFGVSPREFEVLCADVCRGWGYTTRLGQGVGDGGVDIELWRDGVFGIAQCKLYRGTVPIAMVRDFYGTMVHRGAHVGFFFTTGRFPASAHEFVEGKEIRLVDGAYLRAILLEQRQRHWLTRLSSRIVRS